MKNLQSIQEFEAGILCAMFKDYSLISSVDKIMMDDFIFDSHGVIFAAIEAWHDASELHQMNEDIDIEAVYELLRHIKADFDTNIIDDVFSFSVSENPQKDIQVLLKNSIDRYALKNQKTKDNVVKIGIQDDNCLWSVEYIANQCYRVEMSTHGTIPKEYQFDFIETMKAIDASDFTKEGYLPWNEDNENASRYLFVR